MIEITDPSLLMMDSVRVSDSDTNSWTFKVYSRSQDDLRIVSCYSRSTGKLLTMTLCHAMGKESIRNKGHVSAYLNSSKLKSVDLWEIEYKRIKRLKSKYGLEDCINLLRTNR